MSFLDGLIRYLRFRQVIKYIPRNSLVCDIGCGKDAYFLKKSANLIKYGFGFDRTIENYKDKKLELKRNEGFENISLENESCDTITMMAVLEHLENPQETLKETCRILKKQGGLILTTPTPLAKPLLEFLAFLNLIDKREIMDHKNYFWPKKIKTMLAQSGFKEIKSYYFELGFNSLTIAEK